ncbi:hypothetical protein DMR_29290 [Solidesulfovibrio magneticus RS-1]|uniref:Uncharacterized protein n=1 Tax=Solidesulfovibrio magneticus (strain ATCC 700980 / DSM 13731 / RS-1) TaxID=573370 RepID=C4XHP6_SOLM1|nr:hypothetical protein DMR_29290 [Solidesulfovibrio magneticus RS-1]
MFNQHILSSPRNPNKYMPFRDIRHISTNILGEISTTTYDKKVLLIMYYSELLALNFVEIEELFKTHGRIKLHRIFYLDVNFVEYVYSLFLNSGIDTIMKQLFERLTKIQELLHQRKHLKSCETSKIIQ